MILHVTYCSRSKSKKDGEIRASERYLSERIQRIKKEAQGSGEKFVILSGKYGLLSPEDEIPFYDKLLEEDDLEEMTPLVGEQLDQRCVSKVVYHTREVEEERIPYFMLIRDACESENVDFERRMI